MKFRINTMAGGPQREFTSQHDFGRQSKAIRFGAAILLCVASHAYAQVPPAAPAAISAKYAGMGGASGVLGTATSAVTGTADGGAYQKYQSGTIYWSAATSAHEVHGLIFAKYSGMGGTTALGYPTTDETAGKNDANLRYNHFQGGTISWKSAPGAHEVHGDIWLKYINLGGPDGILGAALTDESTTPDGIGRYNHFDGGSIYWTLKTGAHEVHGLIRDKWANLSWERSFLGYPVTDEQGSANAAPVSGSYRVSKFQHGQIVWTPKSGAVAVEDLAEVWESRQKSDFVASITGPRNVLTILYNPHWRRRDVDASCQLLNTPDVLYACAQELPMPSKADIERALFGMASNEPPPNPNLPRSFVGDFFRENSGPTSSTPAGRLNLVNAGVLEIDAPTNKRGFHYRDGSLHTVYNNDGWLDGYEERDANAISMAATDKNFNFKYYDSIGNNDGKLSSDELAIIIVSPDLGDSGYVRPVTSYQSTPGFPYPTFIKVDLKVGGVTIKSPNDDEVFQWYTHPATADNPIRLGLPGHELGHLLVGVPDAYGTTWKYDPGVYSRMGAGCSACETTHFDPFLKLKAKWLDYTVLAGNDQYTYTLRNIEEYGEGLILYDPARGRKEYFILEYRRPGTSYDAGRGLAGGGLPYAGLAVWHIIEDGDLQKLLKPSSSYNWYQKGVLLEPASNGSIVTAPVYMNKYAYVNLTWSDGSPVPFGVNLLDATTGTPPAAVHLSITR